MIARLVLTVSIVVVGACGSATVDSGPTKRPGDAAVPYYAVVNLAGPPMDVLVNGVQVTHLSCGMSGFDLTTGPGVPGLPWDILLVRANGGDVYSGHVDAVPESRVILIRSNSAEEQPWYLSAGIPARSPCPE